MRPSPRLTHAYQLAAAAGWTPTVANYLGRVPKPSILEAVREAKGDAAAELIDHLRKLDMAHEAVETPTDDTELPDFLVEAAE